MPRGTTPRTIAKRKRGTQEGPRATPKFPAKMARPSKKDVSTAPKPPKLAKGYNPTTPERVAEILKRLDQLYPEVTCALTHRSAWELLVATILSAQSTDVRVNMVTPELFKK